VHHEFLQQAAGRTPVGDDGWPERQPGAKLQGCIACGAGRGYRGGFSGLHTRQVPFVDHGSMKILLTGEG